MTKPTICLIGAGAAGTSLLLALHKKGFQVTGVASRSLASAHQTAALVECDYVSDQPASVLAKGQVIIIATPDDAIQTVCDEMLAFTDGVFDGQTVIHLSGAKSADILSSASDRGAGVCALHPMQTLVDPHEGAALLERTWFCLEGNEQGIAVATQLVDALSGHKITISQADKPLYHAALCVASNYFVVLEDMASQMLVRAGVDPADALPALLPLIQGAVANLQHSGLPQALTGPISRGDVSTISSHLKALNQGSTEGLAIYKTLGLASLDLASRKGQLDAESFQQLSSLLSVNHE